MRGCTRVQVPPEARDIRSPETGDTGGCESPDTGTN